MILVSSEHSFPNQLRDPKLDFHLENVNEYIYAGEVPPKDMYELLTTKWGIESDVVLALIKNLWRTYLRYAKCSIPFGFGQREIPLFF